MIKICKPQTKYVASKVAEAINRTCEQYCRSGANEVSEAEAMLLG